MLYYLDLGKTEQNIAKQAFRAGQPLPDRIANAPALKFGLEFFLQAFFDLDAERSHALSLTPIPWSAINLYADAYQLDDEGKEDLLFYIRLMDNAYLEDLEKKRPKTTKSPGKRK